MGNCQTCYERGIRCSNVNKRTNEACNHCKNNGLQCSSRISNKSQARSGDEVASRRLTRSQTANSRNPPIKYEPDEDAMQSDEDRKVVKVQIAMDFGSQATKAAWMVTRKCDNQQPRLLKDVNVIREINTMIWPGGLSECPTEIAFIPKQDPEGTSIAMYWGWNVETALSDGKICEQDILRGLKPAVFATEKNQGNHHEETIIRRIRCILDRYPSLGVLELTPLNILRTVEKKIFSYVLEQIKDAVGSELHWPWPVFDPQKDSPVDYLDTFNFSDFPDCIVEVALPVPAGLSVEHCQLALDTAREAGIPNCYLVAEPTCVAAMYAQEEYEMRPQFVDRSPILIVDHGCGTVDVALMQISTDNSTENVYEGSMCLKEMIPGVMEWCGGDSVNKAFMEMVRQELDVDQIVQEINRVGRVADPLADQYTVDSFLDYLDREFEVKKKKFGGNQDIQIPLPRGAPLIERSKLSIRISSLYIPSIRLSRETMQELFLSSNLEGILKLMNGQLHSFWSSLPPSDRQKLFVKRALLVGGGSENTYITKYLRSRYAEAGLNKECKFEIDVIHKGLTTQALSQTVRGALLLLLDKPFVGARFARRGYCFAQDEIPCRRYENGQVKVNDMIGEPMAQDAAKFVLKIRQPIDGRFEQNIRGTRGLWLDEVKEDGWEIEEILWYTDNAKKCRDGVWVRSPQTSFSEAGIVAFNLTVANASQFPVERNTVGREFKSLQYEVTLVIENFVMEFEIVIPRSGRFDVGTMQDFIKKKATLHCGHAFEIYNTSNKHRQY